MIERVKWQIKSNCQITSPLPEVCELSIRDIVKSCPDYNWPSRVPLRSRDDPKSCPLQPETRKKKTGESVRERDGEMNNLEDRTSRVVSS